MNSALNQHVVYRCYAAGGVLLYVGCTHSLGQRLRWHGRYATWWADVDRVDIRTVGTRRFARHEEAQAIRSERPLHNVQHQDPAHLAERRAARAAA